MIINVTPIRLKQAAKRLKTILHAMGFDISHTGSLELTARLFGFETYRLYCIRDFAALSPLDEELPENEFQARDEFQMRVLEEAGYGQVARELLERVNPSGSWSKGSTEPV